MSGAEEPEEDVPEAGRVEGREHEKSRLDRLRASVDEAQRHVRLVFLLFLAAGFYFAVMVGSTTDEQLLRADPITMPLLNLRLPIVPFYFIAPLLMVLFHLYLLVHLYLLSRKLWNWDQVVRQLPEASAREEQRDLLYPFPFGHLFFGEMTSSAAHLALRSTVWIPLIVGPPFLILFAQVRFLCFQDSRITLVHFTMLLIDLALLWILWPTIRSRDSSWAAWWNARNRGKWYKITGFQLAVLLTVLVAAFSLLAASVPGGKPAAPLRNLNLLDHEALQWRVLDLRNKTLVKSPPPPQIIAQYLADGKTQQDAIREQSEPLELEGRSLRGADFREAFLTRAKFQEAQLQRARFWGANLRGADLSFAQLQGAELWKANLEAARLTGADLQGTNLSFAQLQGADLWKADLRAAKLTGTDLQDANLSFAQLQGADLSFAWLQGAELPWANLRRANLSFSWLHDANLSSARFQDTDLSRAYLHGANLSSAWLQGANLSSMWLQGANLSFAQLQGADLSFARLRGAKLRWADLQGANLRGADLQGAYLPKAQLQGANLSFAELQGADLRQANLRGACLTGANLEMVIFSGAEMGEEVFDSDKLTLADLREIVLTSTDAAFWKGLRKLISERAPPGSAVNALRWIDETENMILYSKKEQGGFPDPMSAEGTMYEAGDPFTRRGWLEPPTEETYHEHLHPNLLELACSDQWIAVGMLRSYRSERDRKDAKPPYRMPDELVELRCENALKAKEFLRQRCEME